MANQAATREREVGVGIVGICDRSRGFGFGVAECLRAASVTPRTEVTIFERTCSEKLIDVRNSIGHTILTHIERVYGRGIGCRQKVSSHRQGLELTFGSMQ